MSQSFNENNNNEEKYAYKNVMGTSQNSRAFSVASLILSILSIICSFLPVLGIILGVLAISFAIFSRRNLGYFDGFSLAGLILGIIGAVFSVAALILRNILISLVAGLFS